MPRTVFVYGPAKLIPADFIAVEKALLTGDLVKLINEILTPAYQRLAGFLQNESAR
jgi:uncharacterized protein (DUF885 family)